MGLKAEERRADPQLRDLSFLGGGFLEGGLTWGPQRFIYWMLPLEQ